MSGPMGYGWFYENPLGEPWPGTEKYKKMYERPKPECECCGRVAQLEEEFQRMRRMMGGIQIKAAEKDKTQTYGGVQDVEAKG